MSQNMTLNWSEQTYRALGDLAASKKVKPEQAVMEIVERELERQRVRRLVHAEFERKRKNPARKQAWKRFEAAHKQIKRVPEAELVADIDIAVRAVRAQIKKEKRGT